MRTRFVASALLIASITSIAPFAAQAARPSGHGSAGFRRIAFLGGGSGETDSDNFLVQDLRAFRKALVARGWDVRAAIGPKDGLLPGSKSATNAHLEQGIRAALAAARPRDEVLLLFHTHGRERETSWGQRSHSLVSEDRDPSGADPGFDLDSIEPLLVSARDRGVRIALVDLSCYSGATQALKGASCTATLAAPQYVSLCSGRPEERGFNSRFFKLPPKGERTDLEAQFLQARKLDRDSINLPQLSSLPAPAAGGWNAFLQEVDPLDIYEDIKELRSGAKPFDPKRLLSEIDAWGKTRVPRAPASLVTLKARIAERLQHVLAVRAEIEKALPPLARDYDDATLKIEVPGRDPLSISAGNLGEYLDKIADPEIDLRAVDGYTHVQRGLLASLSGVAADVEKRYASQLRDFRERRESVDRLTDELARSAGELVEIERDLYDAAADVGAGSPDPCRDFQL